MKKRIFVVLGMHRSGTSVFTKAIVEMGAFPGTNLMTKNKWNPKGYWENTVIVDINMKILSLFNMNWSTIDNPILNRFRNYKLPKENFLYQKAENILRNMLKVNNDIVIKDPRISILLPFWKRVFSKLNVDVIYLVALRNPIEASKSLSTIWKNIKKEQGLKLWVYYNYMILKNIKSRAIFCSFESLIQNHETELTRIANNLHLKKGVSKVSYFINEFLDSKLKHYNEDIVENNTKLENTIIDLYNSFSNWLKSDTIPAKKIEDFSASISTNVLSYLGFHPSNYNYDSYQLDYVIPKSKKRHLIKKNMVSGNNDINLISIKKNLCSISLCFHIKNVLIIFKNIALKNKGNEIDFKIKSHKPNMGHFKLFLFSNEEPRFKIFPVIKRITNLSIQFTILPMDPYSYFFMKNIELLTTEELSAKKRNRKRALYFFLRNIFKFLLSPKKRTELFLAKKELKKTKLFDKYYYLGQNKDVSESSVDPSEHFLISGINEDRTFYMYYNTKDLFEMEELNHLKSFISNL